MTSIKDIEGIGLAYADKLAEVGIRTTDKLLEHAASRAGRHALASETGLDESLILEWVNRADLFRIKGVGEEFSDLLEAAGVDSPAELAHRNAANLYETLLDLNEEKQLVRRAPSLHELEAFIDEAKKLPKVVTH